MKRLLWLAAILIQLGAPLHGTTCSPDVFINAILYSLPAPPGQMLVADFNNDGLPDIAVMSNVYYENEIWILLGNPDGTFQPVIVVPGLRRGLDHHGPLQQRWERRSCSRAQQRKRRDASR